MSDKYASKVPRWWGEWSGKCPGAEETKGTWWLSRMWYPEREQKNGVKGKRGEIRIVWGLVAGFLLNDRCTSLRRNWVTDEWEHYFCVYFYVDGKTEVKDMVPMPRCLIISPKDYNFKVWNGYQTLWPVVPFSISMISLISFLWQVAVQNIDGSRK